MEQFVRYLTESRKEFLEKQKKQTNAAYLSRVLFLEVAGASWLWEMGARETAKLILVDLIELSIYAGCQFFECHAATAANTSRP